MSALQRASVGYLLRHPWQLLLALLGIAIGVAVIVAVDLANSSARRAFELSMDAVTGAATHQVIGGPRGVDERVYTELRVEHGLQAIAPVVSGHAEAGGLTFSVLGIDVFAEREIRQYSAPGGGAGGITEMLTTNGAVLLPPSALSRLGIAVGDSLLLATDGGERQAVVVGTLAANGGQAALDNVLVTDIATAQTWFGRAGYLDRIDARLHGEDEVALLRGLLPAGMQLLSAAGRTDAVAELSNAFMVNLTAMSLLALLVGVFLIYNSVSFAVLQRRNLIATLRAIGLTRAQALRLILGESLVLGAAGSVFGLIAGIVLGNELLDLVARSINDLYFRVTVTAVTLDPLSLTKGFVAGAGATVCAALVPALEAASYAPALALRRATLEQRAGGALPCLALAGVAAALVTWPLLASSGQSLVVGLAALFVLVLGVALCVPWLVHHLVRRLAPVAQSIGGNMARMAVAGIGANLSRTGVAIVALAVAVSATIGVSVMVSSFRLAVIDWLDSTLQADIYVAAEQGSLDPAAVQRIAAVAGVTAFSSSRRVWIESNEGRTRLIALRMTERSRNGTVLIDAAAGDVWPAFDSGGAVLVSESFAYRNELQPGSIVRLQTDRGMRAFPVAASYRSFDSNPAAVLVSRSIYDMFWDDDATDSLGLELAAGASPGSVSEALRNALPDVPLQLRSNADLKTLSLGIFDRTFIITDVLYWLAIGVAIVGILAAMLALQMERARELATLRALGITRGQLGGMVTLQSTLVGVLSGIAAIPLGLAMAALLVEVINRRAFGWSMDLQVPGAALWQALLLATGSAAVAGLYPAWRAGRSQPALAMRED